MKGERTGESAAVVTRSKSITERPLDVLYVAYFGIHLIASVAVDAQLAYPPYSQRIFPEPLRKVLQDYLTTSKDPFLIAATEASPDHVWFRVLLASETFVQIPFFVLGIWGLIHDDQRTYPFMIAYGTLAASSTLQCIGSILWGSDGIGLSSLQTRTLLQNYIPFCVIPIWLTLDMLSRVHTLLSSQPTTTEHLKNE